VLEPPYKEKYGLLIQIKFSKIKRNNQKVKFYVKKVNNTFQGNGHQHQ